MRSRKARKANRKVGIFIGLLALSILALVLPSSYTHGLISCVQPLSPFQAMANSAAKSIDDSLTGPDAPMVTSVEFEEVLLAKEAAENRLASMARQYETLEEQNRELTAIRQLGLDERGELIPANVIGEDLIAHRESRTVDQGSVADVPRGAAVVSNHFSATVGSDRGVGEGLPVLASEALVGEVVQVGTHTCRVRLLTDAGKLMAVTISQRRGDSLSPLNRRFILSGTGNELLEVRDVAQCYINQGDIRAGDMIMTADDWDLLPVPVIIGTVEAIRPDPDNGTLFILHVRPAVEPDQLRRVYIVNTGGRSPG